MHDTGLPLPFHLANFWAQHHWCAERPIKMMTACGQIKAQAFSTAPKLGGFGQTFHLDLDPIAETDARFCTTGMPFQGCHSFVQTFLDIPRCAEGLNAFSKFGPPLKITHFPVKKKTSWICLRQEETQDASGFQICIPLCRRTEAPFLCPFKILATSSKSLHFPVPKHILDLSEACWEVSRIWYSDIPQCAEGLKCLSRDWETPQKSWTHAVQKHILDLSGACWDARRTWYSDIPVCRRTVTFFILSRFGPPPQNHCTLQCRNIFWICLRLVER